MHATGILTIQNIEFLRQGRRLIEGLTDELYRDGVPPLGQSGVGGHFRHCLDFYACFVEGLETGRIDYDARSRDRGVERDRRQAMQAIDAVITVLEGLAESSADRPLLVSVDSPGEELGGPLWSQSSLLRELQMLGAHTVHHYALIAMLLKAREVQLDEDFGIAPSTIRFQQLSTPVAS